MKQNRASLLVFIAVSLLTASAPAATLFSNLGQTTTTTDPFVGFPTADFREATEFVTGSLATSITGLTVMISNPDTVSHTWSAFLYSGTGANPTSLGLLNAFTAVSATLAAGSPETPLTFSTSAFALAPNTQYWIALAELGSTATTAGLWSVTSSNAGDGGDAFTVSSPPGMSRSTGNSGLSWAQNGITGNGKFALFGDVAPEPSRMMLMLIGGCLALSRRRRA